MRFECPHGWKSVSKLGNVTFESATVNICDGICDSCDLYGIESWEFYDDTSPEATKRFLRANAREHREHLLAPSN
jgi:hypothetical protein